MKSQPTAPLPGDVLTRELAVGACALIRRARGAHRRSHSPPVVAPVVWVPLPADGSPDGGGA
jgi:hypothetical protein